MNTAVKYAWRVHGFIVFISSSNVYKYMYVAAVSVLVL